MISLLYSSLSAQNLMRMINDKQYYAQVKLVDEFRARFNGSERRTDIVQEDSTGRLQLLLLCDGERYMNDEQFQHRYNDFMNEIIADSTRLNYSDSMWYATAVCDAQIKGESTRVTIYLSIELRDKDMYKWVISDVVGEMFDLGGYDKNNDIFLMPNQHEQNFMALTRNTSEMNKYITLYSKNSYVLNRLNVFNTLVYYQLLQIKAVNKLTFTFLQVPGYIFSIEYFVRDSMNCGWLISDVQEMSDVEKKEILNKIH